MHVGHTQNIKYYLSKELEIVHEERDLGVNITADLKSAVQCRKSAGKARGIIGMGRRNFRRLNRKDFLLIYKSYIRPHLEYCIQAWSPHLEKDIDILERVQRTATSLVQDLRGFNYETRLKKLGQTTLKLRRQRGDMLEVCNVLARQRRLVIDHGRLGPRIGYNLGMGSLVFGRTILDRGCRIPVLG